MINHRSKSNLILLVVVSLSALYLIGRFNCGWIPHDEGALAHSAERVLEGELPHRDFDDIYTGGLAFLHSLAFRVFGLRLLSLRLVLLIFSLAFIPAVYRIASRAASPVIAGFITILCLVWSLPNHFASLASWYNLFFATFGTLALLKYLDTKLYRWLLMAGLFGGLSFLIKVTGIYYIAAILLFFVYREQILAASSGESIHSAAYPLSIGIGLIFFGVSLGVLIYPHLNVMTLLHYIIPGFTICGFLFWSERKLGCGSSRTRWKRMSRMVVPFAAGVMIPILIYILPYLTSSSLNDLFHGIFILPGQRLQFGVHPLPPVVSLLTAMPLAALLIFPFLKRRRLREGYLLTPVVIGCGLLLVFGGTASVYRAFLYSTRPVVPLLTIVGCFLLTSPDRVGELNPLKRQQIFLLLAMAAMVSLIQFPYALYIYFCHVAPLVILAIFFVVAGRKDSPRKLLICFGVLYLLFALIWLNRASIRSGGREFVRVENTVPLGLERGGLKVSPPFPQLYRLLVSRINQHSLPDDYIYASTDCPEVYFLSGRKNPTRTLFDFFDTDFKSDPQGRSKRILALIEERKINVVVIRWHGDFSGWINRDFLKEIEARFQNRFDLQIFTVFWREGEVSNY